jgi:hypothetical protein
MPDCDCIVVYEPVEVHLRALEIDGAEDVGNAWYLSDDIVDWDFSPDVEEGQRKVIKCSGRPKLVLYQNDTMLGGTLKLTFCCENGEVDYIVSGSAGEMTFDSSSPPCVIDYRPPTLEEQEDAVPFEAMLYLKEISGSNIIGYKCLHFYKCLPAFASESGAQEEYTQPSYTIRCTENPNY